MFYDPDGIYVVDNVISQHYQDYLEDLIFNKVTVPFYYNSTTNGISKKNNPELISNWGTFDTPQFTHNIIEENVYISDWGKFIVEPFLGYFTEFFECDDYDVFRSKVNLSTGIPRTRKIVEPHVDSQQKLWSVVYFVNDVPNSDLLIGKQTFNGEVQNKFKLSRKIETKKGRAVFFDSRRFHSAGKCPLGYSRSVINFVIGKYEDL